MKFKPPKPYPTFPLFAHARGYWAKKIDNRQEAFGRWAWPDPAEYELSWKSALRDYNHFSENKAHGRAIDALPESITIGELVNLYLAHQHRRMAGQVPEIGAAYFADVRKITTQFRDYVGRGESIEQLEQFNPSRPASSKIVTWIEEQKLRFAWHAFNKRMVTISGLFSWAEHPITGPLKRPFRLRPLFAKRADLLRRREKRLAAETRGKQLWTLSELQGFFQHAKNPLRAMLGLMYFAGYGPGDCSALPQQAIVWEPDKAIGLPKGWGVVNFQRPKTEIDRAAVLPAFVMDDLRASAAARPAPATKAHSERVFLTPFGRPWVRDRIIDDPQLPGVILKVVRVDSVAQEFRRLRDQLAFCPDHGWIRPPGRGAGFRSDRQGVTRAEKRPKALPNCPACGKSTQAMRAMGCYTFRHTATTYASGATDPDALALFEGHAIAGIRRHYIEEIDSGKLLNVAQRLLERLGHAVPALVETIL